MLRNRKYFRKTGCFTTGFKSITSYGNQIHIDWLNKLQPSLANNFTLTFIFKMMIACLKAEALI